MNRFPDAVPRRWRPLRSVLLAWLCLLCGVGQAAAEVEPAAGSSSDLPRHALELRALVEPEAVLQELPGALARARKTSNQRELALLYLAEANACRVVADWLCQRNAGAKASATAKVLGDALLQARGLIAESRATLALQDYSRGERLLAEAEVQLQRHPSAELAADIQLAYSSLSHTLGKHALAVEYADRGLLQLDRGQALPMQARLLRNRARALAQLGRYQEAQQSLLQGLEIAEQIVDPKLSAELYLEAARVAGMVDDVAAQRANGRRVLELATRLTNSQLAGLGHEVLGLAALAAGDRAEARSELQAAYESFKALGLARDELRLARSLIDVMLAQAGQPQGLEPLVRRFLELDRTVIQSDRAQAADDFDARLKYAQQELDVVRLESEARLAQERERALAEANRLTLGLMLLAALVLAVLLAFFVQQRRSNRRLQRAFEKLRASEARAVELLRLSRGYVYLHDLQGRLLTVNPAAAQALGHEPEALVGRLLAEFVAESSRAALAEQLELVRGSGEASGELRVRHGDGIERWWRCSSRRSAAASGPEAYVIGHAVDVTDQVLRAEALRAQSQHDALTGAWNRRRLDEFEQAQGAGQWAVVNIDLDHFKLINDSQGHDRGDQVLVGIAEFLRQRVRSVDSVVRTGGDEFVLLLPDTGASALAALLARLQADADAAPCRFSTGHAVRAGQEPLAATLARADTAMYEERKRVRGVAPAQVG